MIARVGNKQSAGRVKHHAVRLFELNIRARLTVAGETRFAVSGQGGDDAGLCVDESNHMVASVCDVQIARRVDPNFVWPIEGGLGCRAAVAGVAKCSVASDAPQLFAGDIGFPNALVVNGGQPHVVANDLDSKGVAKLDCRRGAVGLVRFVGGRSFVRLARSGERTNVVGQDGAREGGKKERQAVTRKRAKHRKFVRGGWGWWEPVQFSEPNLVFQQGGGFSAGR